jgi:hypothetical protein
MTASMKYSVGVLNCLLVCWFGQSAAAQGDSEPTTRPTGEPIAQLAPGKKAGTFHLVYHATAKFTMPGRCALQVSLTALPHQELIPLRLKSAGGFTLEADVPPGTYNVTVSPQEVDGDYWPSEWQRLHVSKSGGLYRPRGWLTQSLDFVLDRRLKDISPASLAVANTAQPVLRWPAVAGATHYQGDYWINEDRVPFDVEETQFIIGAGVTAGAGCEWRVVALDAEGKTLARGAATFFGKGTDPAVIAKMRAEAGTCPIDLPAGRPYIGIQPLSTQVPKDPAKPVGRSANGGAIVWGADSGFIPGLQVMEVFPGSPAVDADLIPDDVIVAIDGQPVASDMNMGDQAGFNRKIAEFGEGRKIKLTVRRFPRELTLNATIGRTGGAFAASAPSPATQPDSIRQNAAPAASATGLSVVWRDVDAGTPAIFPFRAKDGADIVSLKTKQGLAEDTVNGLAEMPDGTMAFGTYGGLTLWNGAELRTYTGPSYAGRRGGVDPGNSGLPANEIQDLLCDSRGRLWVATAYGVCRIDSPAATKWRVLQDPDRDADSRRGIDERLDIQKLFQTSDGTLVLGGRCSSILLVNPKTDQARFVHQDDDPNHWITGIAEDGQHRLWFAVTGVGVLRFDGQNVEKVEGPWVIGKDLRGVAIDGAGTVWIADAEKGLSALHADGTTESVGLDRLPGNLINGLMTDRAGRLWVVSYGGLAVHAPQADGKGGGWQYAELEEAGTPPALLETRGGQWWVGELGASRRSQLPLSSVNPHVSAVNRFKRKVEASYPNVKSLRDVAIGRNGTVVGFADQRLFRYDGKNWEDLSGRLGKFDIYQVRADSKGTIWVATSGNGLIGLDPDGAIRRYNNDPDSAASVIYSIDQTPDGTLYAGTQHGVYRLRGEIWEPVKSDLFQVGQVLTDHRGRVWMMEVTYSNLYAYDGRQFREVKQQTSIADLPLEIGSLRLDDAGNVLVDVPARPGKNQPQRTFKWDAAGDNIGPPVEVRPLAPQVSR